MQALGAHYVPSQEEMATPPCRHCLPLTPRKTGERGCRSLAWTALLCLLGPYVVLPLTGSSLKTLQLAVTAPRTNLIAMTLHAQSLTLTEKVRIQIIYLNVAVIFTTT